MRVGTAPRGDARPRLRAPTAVAVAAACALLSGIAAETGGAPVVAAAPVAVATRGGAAALAATLRDQHGRPGGFEPAVQPATVVLVVSAARLKRIRDWETSLRRRFEDLRFVRVADVPPSRPPARYEDVAERLRRHVPPEVSVLVDMDRVWATAFELDTREVTLLVFDGQRGFAGQLSGRPTPERLARAFALVEPFFPPAPGPPR